MQFIRLIVFGFIAMSVVYLSISIYSRSVRREKLEERWDADPQGDEAAREKFIERGMAEYHGSLRKRLILLVYVVPTLIVCTIMILVN